VGGDSVLTEKLSKMGNISKNEKISIGILLFAITLWVTAGMTGIDSYSVALIGAVLFILSGVITWNDAQKNVDWGLIVFFEQWPWLMVQVM